MNNYDSSKNKTHNDWQKSIKEIEALRQKYFDAGKLPYSKSESVWQKFKDSNETSLIKLKINFTNKKKILNKTILKKKIRSYRISGCLLKDSEDWETATKHV